MRDWSTKKTANWWQKADHRYNLRDENQPSAEYLRSHYNFNSVLEVGSGTGRLINTLPGHRGAIDINSHLLKLVDDRVFKYNFDISKPMDFPNRFDLVYTFQVLQHLNHKQFLQALDNIKNIATKEIWLMEGQVSGCEDGEMTHHTGSFHHDYAKYLDCYQIDELHGGKIKVFRAKI